MKRTIAWICVLALTLVFAGCGKTGIERQISQADEIMTEAVNEGAELKAPIALQTARDKIENAKRMLREGKTDSAMTEAALSIESAKEALSTTKEANSIPDAGH